MNDSTYGKFTIYKHENVIVAKAEGQIDLATMVSTTGKISEYIRSMEGPFASLMDYTDWGLYTEEAIEPLKQFQYWLLKKGHKVEVAIIGRSTLKRNAREALLAKLEYKPDQIYVETEQEGWDWLVNHGYCDQPPD